VFVSTGFIYGVAFWRRTWTCASWLVN